MTDAVSVPTTRLGDFKDGSNGVADDYSYDANGNLITDQNKSISSITYNHLNLPQVITVTGKGAISYTYDAAGNKLKKVTVDNTVSPAKTTTTLYIGGAVYQNDLLQFIGMEEGWMRFRASDNNFQFDYMLKDHLGNVRAMLTEEQQTDAYPAATMETATITTESGYYGNLNNTQYARPSWFSDPLYSGSTQVAQVKNTGGTQKIGPHIVLKVMAGDSYNIRVASGWNGSSATNSPTNVLTDLLNLLSGGVAGASGGKATQAELQAGGSGLNTGLTNFMSTQTSSGSKPKAYISWILLDEQFRVAKNGSGNIIASGYSGFEQVGASGVTTIHALSNLTVAKSGYLYIYTSNEAADVDVFFDNLQVTHLRGPLLEETHYYPFGLTMAGISSKAAGYLQNKYKYNRGTELNSDLDLHFYETDCRLYDPQIGRFWQVDELAESNWEWSPFMYALNNPILYNDPLGLDPEKGLTPGTAKVLDEVVVTSIPKGHWAKQRMYYNIMDQLNRKGASIDQIAQPNLREMMHRYDGITKHREAVAAMTRESDKVFLEIGSFFVPMGWITKLKYAKYVSYLFKAKRGLAGFKAFKYASEFGIKTYRELKKISPLGSEVHHLIEQRFAKLFGQAEKDIASIVLTKEEHQVFTNAWRTEIGYEGSKAAITTGNAVRADVEAAARKIYSEYPEILKALGL